MTIHSACIPTHVFNLIARVLEESGLNPSQMMVGTGLAFADLSKPDTLVSFQQAQRLIYNALSVSPDSGLGLTVANRINISDWGMFGYAVASCATLEEALGIGQRYNSAATRLTETSVIVGETTFSLRTDTLYPVGNLLPFFIEEDLGGVMHMMYSYNGPSVKPKEVLLSYSAPSYSERYRQHFLCPVKFNCSVNEIVWDISLLKHPLPGHNPVAAQHSIRLCEELIRDQEESSDLVEKIRRRLLQSPGEFASASTIATELNLSESTLRRSLRELGTTYQSILDSVREKMAIQYLATSRLPLEDIAYLVGFNDVSNFRRAFRKWTGKAPLTYRKDMPGGRRSR